MRGLGFSFSGGAARRGRGLRDGPAKRKLGRASVRNLDSVVVIPPGLAEQARRRSSRTQEQDTPGGIRRAVLAPTADAQASVADGSAAGATWTTNGRPRAAITNLLLMSHLCADEPS